MKRSLLLLFPALLLFACGNSTENDAASDKNSTAVSLELKKYDDISLAIPNGWEVVENADGVNLTVISPQTGNDPFRENFNIIVKDSMNREELEGVYKENISHYREFTPTFEITDEGKTRIDGAEGWWVEYSLSYDNLHVNGKEFYVMNNNKAYIITYAEGSGANSEYRQMFDETIRTMKLQ